MDIGFGMRLVRRIDFYACWLPRGNINEAREMRISRTSTLHQCDISGRPRGSGRGQCELPGAGVVDFLAQHDNPRRRGRWEPRVDFRSAADAVLKVGMGRRPASRARASVPR